MNYSKYIHRPAMPGLVLARQCQLLLLVIASLFLLPAVAWAEIAANVSFVSGTVTAQASGASERELAKGHDIFSGDSIDTAENGRIQMRFTDGGLVSLMPRTLFSVDEYLHEGKATGDDSLVFGMLRGGMRTITGSIGKIKHESYEVKTPVATLGIRGTEYVAVIGPPDTLRVHVGEGKVVITNDHGTLEVGAGKKAVVVLGSAPELTEKGPLYIASAPGGDGSVIDGIVSQDPLWRDVVFHQLDNTPTPPIIPPIPPIPPNGSGYLMAGYSRGMSGSGQLFGPGVTSFAATFDQTTGDFLTTDDANNNLNGMQSIDVGYLAGNISWGVFMPNGGGILGGNSTALATAPMPYVVGSSVQTLPTGILNYSLASVTPVRDATISGSGGIVGTLDSFNLSIDVDNMNYSFNSQLTTGTNVYTIAPSTGSLTPSFQHGFSLSTSNVTDTSLTCFTDCGFQVEGFLAGPNAEQAGVSYLLINDNNDPLYTGAAGLTRP